MKYGLKIIIGEGLSDGSGLNYMVNYSDYRLNIDNRSSSGRRRAMGVNFMVNHSDYR